MSETIEICKIWHFHSFQHPKLRVHECFMHDFYLTTNLTDAKIAHSL